MLLVLLTDPSRLWLRLLVRTSLGTVLDMESNRCCLLFASSRLDFFFFFFCFLSFLAFLLLVEEEDALKEVEAAAALPLFQNLQAEDDLEVMVDEETVCTVILLILVVSMIKTKE